MKKKRTVCENYFNLKKERFYPRKKESNDNLPKVIRSAKEMSD